MKKSILENLGNFVSPKKSEPCIVVISCSGVREGNVFSPSICPSMGGGEFPCDHTWTYSILFAWDPPAPQVHLPNGNPLPPPPNPGAGSPSDLFKLDHLGPLPRPVEIVHYVAYRLLASGCLTFD